MFFNNRITSVSKMISFAILLPRLVGFAATNEWYPGGSGFDGWPTNWVAISSLNDPKGDLSNNSLAQLDFVGDNFNPGAYWSADTNYFFIRMRVAVSNVTSSTFRDSHWIYIDRLDYTNGAAAPGMPDYALVWDTKSNDTTKHGLELMTGTNLSATTYWSQMTLNDIDNSSSTKSSPPDFNLSGDGYVRTIDMRPTTNFGYTTFIDFAVKWSFISANTALNSNQAWRIQFGSRNDATDHSFPQDDIAGGFSPNSIVTNSYSATLPSSPLAAAIDMSVYASADGALIELWTVDESGCDDIVIYAWINNAWVEVGRVPAGEVVGEGSNRYTVRASGLAAEGAYDFKVVDEAGHVHYSDGAVAIQAVRIAAVRLEMEALTLSFNTEYGCSYQVLASPDFAAWSIECASSQTADGWSPFTAAPFMAGPGSSTTVRVPVNGRRQAFFKIVKVEP